MPDGKSVLQGMYVGIRPWETPVIIFKGFVKKRTRMRTRKIYKESMEDVMESFDRSFGYWSVAEGITAIETPGKSFGPGKVPGTGHVMAYLIEGEEKAVLWDNGYGNGNIRALVQKLTDLPVMAVNSHNHLDHNGCNPLFENMTVFPTPIMDIVNDDLDLQYYTCPDVPEKLRDAGRKTARAFGVDRRFVHLEFFRLTEDRPGLGKAGDYVGLEVNMRPPGGYTPDMINFAHSADVYQIYAEMVLFNKRRTPDWPEKYYCVYASRKEGHVYTHTHEEIMARYGESIVMQEEMPPVNWPQMGRFMYTARLRTGEEVQAFIDFVQS